MIRRAVRALGRAAAAVRVLSRLAAIDAVLMQRHPCKGCGLIVDVTHPDMTLTRRDDGNYSVWCRWCYKVEKTIHPQVKRRASTLHATAKAQETEVN